MNKTDGIKFFKNLISLLDETKNEPLHTDKSKIFSDKGVRSVRFHMDYSNVRIGFYYNPQWRKLDSLEYTSAGVVFDPCGVFKGYDRIRDIFLFHWYKFKFESYFQSICAVLYANFQAKQIKDRNAFISQRIGAGFK